MGPAYACCHVLSMLGGSGLPGIPIRGPGDVIVTLGGLPAPYTGAAMSIPTGTHNGIGTHTPTVGTDVGAGGLTVAEAAVALGVSVNTIRRWIKDCRVQSERVATPTGYAYRVFPEGVPINGTRADSGTNSGTDQPAPEPATTVAPETQRAEAMAVYTKTLLEPLVARLGEQEAVIRDQAETIGRQGAELEAERAKSCQLATEREAAERSRRRDTHRLVLAVRALAALALVALAASAWVR